MKTPKIHFTFQTRPPKTKRPAWWGERGVCHFRWVMVTHEKALVTCKWCLKWIEKRR